MVSFTPCIYPVIPIVASVIASANLKGKKSSGFFLSLIYVLGLAVVYCALAVIASLTGTIFGQWQNQPAVYFFVGVVLFVFALSLLDIIKLPVMGVFLESNKIKGKNIFSVFFLGMSSGLIVGPCTAPVLGTLLFYVASKQNLFHSISLLFVFSYGIGTSLILIGTFSALLTRLPKSGPWMERIQKISGWILLVIAILFFLKAFFIFVV